jgi:hypothetical protein
MQGKFRTLQVLARRLVIVVRLAKSRHGPDQLVHSGVTVQLGKDSLWNILGLVPQEGGKPLVRGTRQHVGLSSDRHGLARRESRGNDVLIRGEGRGDGPRGLGKHLEVLLGISPPHELKLTQRNIIWVIKGKGHPGEKRRYG